MQRHPLRATCVRDSFPAMICQQRHAVLPYNLIFGTWFLLDRNRCADPFTFTGNYRQGCIGFVGTCFVKLHSSTTVSACSWSRKAYARHGLSLSARHDLAYNLSENDVDVMAQALSRRSLMIRYSMMRWLPIMQYASWLLDIIITRPPPCQFLLETVVLPRVAYSTATLDI